MLLFSRLIRPSTSEPHITFAARVATSIDPMDSEYNSDAAQDEDVKSKGELNDGDNFATRDDQGV
jgi:hypothetical protein